MSPEILGLSLGLGIGILDFIILTIMAKKINQRGIDNGAPQSELNKVNRFLNGMGLLSLILFPIVGYFAGPYVFDSAL